jgi:hypothetical protein
MKERCPGCLQHSVLADVIFLFLQSANAVNGESFVAGVFFITALTLAIQTPDIYNAEQ